MNQHKAFLIVEDDQDLAHAIVNIARSSIPDTVWAASFQAAVEMLESNQIVAVLSDVNLPDKSGIFLINYIEERALNIPIAFYSGHFDSRTRGLIAARACRMVDKPFDSRRLKGLIREIYEEGLVNLSKRTKMEA